MTKDDAIKPVPKERLAGLDGEDSFPEEEGVVGRSMFDTPGAQVGLVTVVVPKEHIAELPLQALVRIESQDDKTYTGIVVAGPFAEPDGLSAESSLIVTTTVRGGIFMPRYHGRVEVEILGEVVGERVIPPRFRPLPNSPVFVLDVKERAEALHCEGDIQIGAVIGDDEVVVGAPSDKKSVLPRHTAVLGTTGGGKSTTMGRLISQAKDHGFAVVLLDTEGEYVQMSEPADDPTMLAALEARGLKPAGIKGMKLYHLTGTESASAAAKTAFGVSFEDVSPHTLVEVLGLSDAQEERVWIAFEVARRALRELKIFPKSKADEQMLLDLNLFERGYPELTLERFIDVIRLCLATADKDDVAKVPLIDKAFAKADAREYICKDIADQRPSSPVSWRIVLAKLARLHGLGIFDDPKAKPIDIGGLVKPGTVSVIDLSGTDAPEVNNIVISDMLRRIHEAQNDAYTAWEKSKHKGDPQKVLVVIEEAHEFLSEARASRMRLLFEQVSRIAKRGRKRWLGLVFVTQLPQHLRRDVLALTNNYVMHRINDAQVITWLRGVVPGIDEPMWRRLPAMAPGQAIVSFTHMARPLVVAIDPSPCKLRMVD